MLRRVRDYAQVKGTGKIDKPTAQAALEMLEVDRHGFDEIDRKLLLTIIEKYLGGPVGLNTLAASLAEEADAIEEIYEPFLIQIGFLDRTPRGRVATHLGVSAFRHQASGNYANDEAGNAVLSVSLPLEAGIIVLSQMHTASQANSCSSNEGMSKEKFVWLT